MRTSETRSGRSLRISPRQLFPIVGGAVLFLCGNVFFVFNSSTLRAAGWLRWSANGWRLHRLKNEISKPLPTSLNVSRLLPMNLAGDLQNPGIRQPITGQRTQPSHGGWVQYSGIGNIPTKRGLGVHLVDILPARSAAAREDQLQLARRYDQMVGND